MLISPSQSGFVPGRIITDNILLAQEMVHHLDQRYSKGNLLVKLDMSKAYDRVSWKFLYAVLEKMGFQQRFILLIKHAIEDCWFTTLVNGEPSGFFKSSHGLRQGDPISPALFILAAEALSRGLDHLFLTNPNMIYQTGCRVKVSHLSYADDILIFTRCEEQALTKLMQFLEEYKELSGQRINYSKSSFIPGKKTNLVAHRIKSMTGFTLKNLLISYLGAPIFKGNKKKILFEPLLDRIRNRVIGWEHCLLSQGASLQLIKSVLATMPVYLLQVLNPPVGVIQRLEQLFAKFFWGSTTNQKKLHWSKWNTVCYPTDEDTSQNSIFWTLRAGKISFWHDWWLPEGILQSIAHQNSPSSALVKSFWDNYAWDINKLLQVVPPHVIELILLVPINVQREDHMHWKLSPNGSFSTKSAWDLARDHRTSQPIFQSLWSPLIRPTISIFTWKLLHSWIPVDTTLKRRGIPLVSRCVCCFKEEESLPHLFLHNPVVLEVWQFFAAKLQLTLPCTDNFFIFLQAWKLPPPAHPHIRDLLPALILWNIWTSRHAAKFEGVTFKATTIISKSVNYLQLLHKTKLFKHIHWKVDRTLAFYLKIPNPPKKKKFRHTIVKWEKPQRDWFKLNTDGASKEPLGCMSNTLAELKAIYRGLQLSIERNITKIWIETDVQVIIKLIANPSLGAWYLQHTLMKIRTLLQQIEFKVSHIFREGNQIADLFANQACLADELSVIRPEQITGRAKGLIKLDTYQLPYFRF
ncbi:UNVERIFIED_CONTAM: hypothetical protein Sradi_0755600 [Sesamum radiatum]|uniref:Reverse transcriptase domain-containing protein n=1 Tax=Sesamum radiatum TaxID=300843 RepID=A0AAW2VSI3_SESRA